MVYRYERLLKAYGLVNESLGLLRAFKSRVKEEGFEDLAKKIEDVIKLVEKSRDKLEECLTLIGRT